MKIRTIDTNPYEWRVENPEPILKGISLLNGSLKPQYNYKQYLKYRGLKLQLDGLYNFLIFNTHAENWNDDHKTIFFIDSGRKLEKFIIEYSKDFISSEMYNYLVYECSK